MHTGKVRPICGLEGLRLQNIYFLGDDADEKLREFSDDLLHDLAGNAMHCGCSTAMTLAVFTAIAWFSLQREKRDRNRLEGSEGDASESKSDAKSKYRRTLSDTHFKAKVAASSIAEALGGGSSGGSADGADSS